MAREIMLPRQCYHEALEEYLLLRAIRKLRPTTCYDSFPSASSMWSRNDLMKYAQDTLPADDFATLVQYADQLCQQLPGVDVDRFPALPTDLTVRGSTAETRARIYLAEGSGSYWAAIRDVVTWLPYASPRWSSVLVHMDTGPILAFISKR